MMSVAGVAAHPARHQAHLVHQLAQFATSTVVSVAPNPTTGAITITATVTPVGTGQQPIGNVTFRISQGNITLGSAPVNFSRAIFTGSIPSSVKPGKLTIVASYGGSAMFAASTGTTTVNYQGAGLGAGGGGGGGGGGLIPAPMLAPAAATVRRFGYHIQPTILVLNFSQPLDPTSAANPSHYKIIAAGPDGFLGTSDDRFVPLKRVKFSSGPNAVSITSAVRLPLNRTFGLVVIGTGPNALLTTSGQPIDGNSDGLPGGDFVTTISRTSVAGTAIGAQVAV